MLSNKKNDNEKERKDRICKELAIVIKEIQETHVHLKEIDSNDHSAEELCDVLEAIFLHGLKSPKSFWPCVSLLIPENIKLVLNALKNSQSDVWKCRAWLRLALVKGQLLEFFQALHKHTSVLNVHYSDQAVIRDAELCEIIVQLLKGVAGFQFQYDHTSALLNVWQPSSLELAGVSITKIYKISWIRGAHQIHENLNPTEITNHIQYNRSFLLTVGEEDGNQGIKICL